MMPPSLVQLKAPEPPIQTVDDAESSANGAAGDGAAADQRRRRRRGRSQARSLTGSLQGLFSAMTIRRARSTNTSRAASKSR